MVIRCITGNIPPLWPHRIDNANQKGLLSLADLHKDVINLVQSLEALAEKCRKVVPAERITMKTAVAEIKSLRKH